MLCCFNNTNSSITAGCIRPQCQSALTHDTKQHDRLDNCFHFDSNKTQDECQIIRS